MDRTGIGLLLVCLLCGSTRVLGQGMVNVAANALGRTCRQSSVYTSLDVACNAANGKTGGTYPVTGGSANCIHTAVTAYYSNENGQNVEDRTPWWEVDLGGVYPVQDITVWGRDVETNRLYPFTITVDGHQCARAVSGDRKISVTCDTVINGRTVRLTRDYKDGPDYSLNMCELKVWGATILAENSFGVADIMSVTGHKSVSSLAIYQRTSQNRKLEMADALAAASGKSQQLVPVKQKAPRSNATASATATRFTAAVTASVTTTTPVATVARNPNILSEEEVSLMFEEFSEDSPTSKPPAMFQQCSMQGCTFNITIHPK